MSLLVKTAARNVLRNSRRSFMTGSAVAAGALAMTLFGDGSTFLQLEANYARTDLWSFGVLAAGTTGGRRSNFGSLPGAGSVLFKVTRYF
jgi:hypothetical protein